MKKSEKAISYFNNGFNCAQSVLTAFAPELDLSKDECLKIATAFGAGMGKQQHICGAVSGGLMVLGLKFGKALNDPEHKKENTYDKASIFLRLFEEMNGSIKCRELLKGLDMNDNADLKKIHDLGLFENECENYIKNAVMIINDLIKE